MTNALLKAVELQGLGRLDESAGLFRQVLLDRPDDAVALYSLSGLLMRQPVPHHDEVLGLTERGVRTSPAFSPLWFARAMALQAVGRREEALTAYDQALVLQPAYKEALLNSGALLREMHRHSDAIGRFNRLLDIDPRHASALGNLGILLTEFKRSDQAMAIFERLLAIDPDYPYAPGLLCYERLHACDWRDVEPLTARIVEGLQAGRKVCKPLGVMAMNDSAADHLRAARIFNTHWFQKPASALWSGERYSHGRLRIAYVSPDLREHPVGHLLVGVIEQHDKRRFETIAISLGVDDSSRLRARMRAAFERFIDACGMTALQIAKLMRELEVDVAIDLAGYTSDSRTEVFAHRPAPVQVGWLGYPGSMGADYFDYILADRHTIPPEHETHYTEKVARLPDTYLPTDGSICIAEGTPTRADCGLPDAGAVLCAFSHDYKVHPRLFEVWMNILRRTPGSVLWLVSRNAFSRENLRREAVARGIDAARLIFATRVQHVEDHLARYRLADLFLDTTPYNAHTTAADALMAGLPVLTCMGNAFPARVAGSLLHAAGLPETITYSLAEYEELAVALIGDPERLAALKAKLHGNRATHPLFDTQRFCRNLEHAVTMMVQEVCATTLDSTSEPRRLKIGGKVRVEGWEMMHAPAAECADHPGNASDLMRFADDTFDMLHASHVVQHFDCQAELGATLREWYRVLKPGGELLISVPDLEVLAGLILDKSLMPSERFMAMRLIFGGNVDAYGHHGVSLTAEFLQACLDGAGFASMRRVESFASFTDTSDYRLAGRRISLNVQAIKASA